MSSWPRGRRILASGVLAALSAAVLAGCIVITGPITLTQQSVVGKVRVEFTVCASGSDDGPEPGGAGEDHPGCPDGGNSSNSASSGNTDQVLVAVRVPAGTGAPQTFTATIPSTATTTLTFTRSPSYENELRDLVPPPAGQAWVGYISNEFPFDDGPDDTPAQQMPVALDLELPRDPGGKPFTGPFRARPVVGGRSVGEGLTAERAVRCGDQAFGGGTGSSTVCIDSPDPAGTDTNVETPTRDLGIAAAAAAADPGQQATVPFTARYAGAADAAASFALTASSTLAASNPTPQVATLTPAADSTNPVGVRVTVPKNATPGNYAVTLRARLSNGQERTGTAALTVRDKAGPVAKALRIQPTSFARYSDTDSIASAGGARVSYQLNEPATVQFTVQRASRGRRVGRRCVAQRRSNRRRRRCTRYVGVRGSFSHQARGGNNSFRFTGFVRRRALRRGSYRLTGLPTDAARNKGLAVRARFRIKR